MTFTMTFTRKLQICAAAVTAVVVVARTGVVGLGVFATLALVVVVCVADTPFTPRGRLRRENGREGWPTRFELRRHLHAKGPSTTLGRTVVGPRVPTACSVSHEETVAVLGGPRGGKTVAMVGYIRQHLARRRGGLIASSSRFDLLLKTLASAVRGRVVWVFAPAGAEGSVGWLLSRMARVGLIRWVHWSPVADCEDPVTAMNRAAAFIEATDAGSAEDQSWLDSASTVLRCYLRAAALECLSMADVYRWATSRQHPQPVDILLAHGDEPWAAELASEVFSDNTRGAASVMRNVRLAIQFMARPSAAKACCPNGDDHVLDVRRLIEDGEALYLVGSERKRDGMTPLLSALTAHLWDTAVTTAQEQENGKLVDTLAIWLDEIKNTARLPLDDWMSVAGGYGIHLGWSVQNPAQLRERWGAEAASAMLDNSSTKLVFGGIDNPDDLERFTARCGPDKEGRPLLPGHRLARLEKFHALLLPRECRPTIVRTPRWKHHAVTAAGKAWLLGASAAALAKARSSTRPQAATRRRLELPPSLPPAPRQVVPPARKPDREEVA